MNIFVPDIFPVLWTASAAACIGDPVQAGVCPDHCYDGRGGDLYVPVYRDQAEKDVVQRLSSASAGVSVWNRIVCHDQ